MAPKLKATTNNQNPYKQKRQIKILTNKSKRTLWKISTDHAAIKLKQ